VYERGYFQASVLADFGVTAHWTNQAEFLVKVDLSQNIERGAPDSSTWTTGSIIISAADGSTLSVALDYNNTSEFKIELDSGELLGPYQWADGFTFGLSRHW